MINVSHFVKFSEALSTTLIDRFALHSLDKLFFFFLFTILLIAVHLCWPKCKRTRDKERAVQLDWKWYRVISCKSFTVISPPPSPPPSFFELIIIIFTSNFIFSKNFNDAKKKKKKNRQPIFPSFDYLHSAYFFCEIFSSSARFEQCSFPARSSSLNITDNTYSW